MIVLGADMHKRSHTIAAVGSTTGELLGERTIQVARTCAAAGRHWSPLTCSRAASRRDAA
jgi:hypothetical protein